MTSFGSQLALAIWLLEPVATTAPASTSEPGTETTETAKAKAREHVGLAAEAFAAAEYLVALEHYEAALTLRPAAKLHYNIGVCHEGIMETAQASDRSRHADQAIDAYNRYLQQAPEAQDRQEVAARIRRLGGTPAFDPGLQEAFDDTLTAGEPPPPTQDLTAAPDPGPPPGSQGRIEASLAYGGAPALAKHPQVAGASALMLNLRAGGLLGEHRRAYLGGELAFHGGDFRGSRITLAGFHLAFNADFLLALAKDRIDLGFGAVAGMARQGLRTGDNAAPPDCRSSDSTLVASRVGGLYGGRVHLTVRFGQARLHGLSLAAQGLGSSFGAGPKGDNCAESKHPFDALDLPRHLGSIWGSVGYAARF